MSTVAVRQEPIAIPKMLKPVPLVFPLDKQAQEGKKMWEEAKRLYEKCLRETGNPPKWDLLMRDPRFAAAVKAEDDRIRAEAEKDIALRRAKEKAIAEKIQREQAIEAARKESEARIERIRQFTMFRLRRDGTLFQSMNQRQELEAMGSPKNPNTGDGWMYHMTSFENLINITRNGLDPSKGGNDSGSCGLAARHPPERMPKGVNNAQELQTQSIQHSRNRVASTNNRLALGTYINQRENEADSIPGHPVGNYAVLLRFRNRYQGRWIKDPMDARAFLIENQPVPVMDIECLTTSGWVPLASVDQEMLRLIVEQAKKQGNL